MRKVESVQTKASSSQGIPEPTDPLQTSRHTPAAQRERGQVPVRCAGKKGREGERQTECQGLGTHGLSQNFEATV